MEVEITRETLEELEEYINNLPTEESNPFDNLSLECMVVVLNALSNEHKKLEDLFNNDEL